MNLADLLNKMINKGVDCTLACSFLSGYHTVPHFFILLLSHQKTENGIIKNIWWGI